MAPPLFAADLNVLIIGSTHSYSEGGESGVIHEKPFNPAMVATHLSSILSQDPAITDTVTVEFEDIYKSKTLDTAIGGGGTIWSFNYRCYSLMQHFVWPEGKAARMADLQDPEWDYIVLCEDPYVMANFPGVYAEGVKMIQSEIAKSAAPAELVLLAQWPESGSGFSPDTFNEMVHRVGNSGNLTVVPAGKAWDEYTPKDTSPTAHPTPKGEYLAAATLYSQLYNRSAKTSGYTYPSDGDAIADHVLGVVQGTVPADEVMGTYTTENAFQMKYVTKRQIDWNEYGTSTEEGFANGLKAAFTAAKVSNVRRNPPSSGNPVDLSYSRGSDVFEPEKQYRVNAAMYDRVHGFPMGDHRNTGPTTMIYGIDKRYNLTYGGGFGNGTDLGVAYSMVREGEVPQDVRGIPVRMLWSKINHFQPTILSHRDGWHLSNELDRAVGAYLYTLLSGRCPVEAEPADQNSTAWKQWFCRKLGYETAWQMAHLTTRAPGFRVCPSAEAALTVSPGTPEIMSVEFVNPPQSDVTVTVTCSSATAAVVGPKTLTFTPSNFNLPQQVTVAALPGAAASEAFDVVFTTTSTDKVYDGLGDSWSYTTTRSSTEAVTQVDNGVVGVNTVQNSTVAIDLDAVGANAANTIIIGPSHGTVVWAGPEVIEYSPDLDYVGSDEIIFASTFSGTQTLGCLAISVEVPGDQVSVTASDSEASEEGLDPGAFTITRLGATGSSLDVLFTISGTADLGTDFTLSHTSPVTIPAGQSSVVLTLTPIDDAVFGERNESVVLTITPDAAYPIGAGSASISIADNDNDAPTADAGSDQALEWQDVTTTPGLSYGTVPGNIDVSTPNPETEVLVDVSSRTEDGIAGNTTEIYTGNLFDADGQISFTEHIDDKARIWIDDVLVLTNDVWDTRTSTANLNLAPGWHEIEIRISNGSGGSGAVSGVGIGYDPAGGATWQALVDPGDGSFLRVNQGAAGAVADLDGTAGDVNGDPLTATWSVVSGPGPVTFGDASALDTTAALTTIGTYVLRLAVDDGYGEVYDEVVITVGSPYEVWAAGPFSGPFTDTVLTSDPDGDGLKNQQEFSFGMDPSSAVTPVLVYAEGGEITQLGLPVHVENGGNPLVVFARRKDHVAAGLTYFASFSADLSVWTTSSATPTVRTAASGDYEAVSVPYPSTVPVSGGGAEEIPQFYRVGVQSQ